MKQLIFSLLFILTLSSCSVAMAARKEGTTISDVQRKRTRGQVLATGAVVINREQKDDGDLVETYLVKKAKGSAVRALMHGILDISTLGAWEVIGTPIEGLAQRDEYFTMRVVYDQYSFVKQVYLI